MFDTISILHPGCEISLPRIAWSRIGKGENFVGPEFSTFKFQGQGQRDTPVAAMEGVLKIIDHFDTPVARQLKAPQRDIFMRFMRGEHMNQDPNNSLVVEQNNQLMVAATMAIQEVARSLTVRIPDMEVKMEDLRNENRSLAIANARMETELCGIKRRNDELETLKDNNQDLLKTNARMEADLRGLKRRNDELETLKDSNQDLLKTNATMEADLRGLKRRCDELETANKEIGELKERMAKVRRVEDLLDRNKLSVIIYRVIGRWPGSELRSVAYALQETYKMVFEEPPRKLMRNGYESNAYFMEQTPWVEDFVRDWYLKK